MTKETSKKATKEMRRETLCVHGERFVSEETPDKSLSADWRGKAQASAQGGLHPYGSVAVPIFQTATFAHPGIGRSTGYDYSRSGNPTVTAAENAVGALEHAADTVACATGMAAVALLLNFFAEGDHIVCSEDLYGGCVRLFDSLGRQRGLSFSYVNTADREAVERAVTKQTRALYIETPSNPTMEVTDLYEMRRIADAHGIKLIVDNTFLTPYFQHPIRLGADFVVHSGTKYLTGHNDTLAGFLCIAHAEDAEKARYMSKTVGASLSPFDAFLALRGIKTLALRMEKQQANALELAKWLRGRKEVEDVLYVGLPEHAGYEVCKRQASGFGGMLSFHMKSEALARGLLERVRLIQYAESLGGTESLLTYPMLQTHGDVPVEIRERLGITDTFLRLSAGVEAADDLIADLEQAMRMAEA